MSADWFRNKSWNSEIASLFEKKLAKARRKEQYLRIQASMLADSHPEVAHALLEQYFSLPDDFDHAQAYVDQAHAYIAQGKLDNALASFRAALKREATFPKLLTQAYLELPYLIVSSGRSENHAEALDVLNSHKDRLVFPVDHFKLNSAQALIAKATGETSIAKQYAHAALVAGKKNNSGFRYHPAIGLATAGYSEMKSLLKELCDA